MTINERVRDFWDRISPRERRLVVLAGVAVPLTIAVWLGLAIHDGLSDMETRNERTRGIEQRKLENWEQPDAIAQTLALLLQTMQKHSWSPRVSSGCGFTSTPTASTMS